MIRNSPYALGGCHAASSQCALLYLFMTDACNSVSSFSGSFVSSGEVMTCPRSDPAKQSLINFINGKAQIPKQHNVKVKGG